MLESALSTLDQFTPEILVILLGLLVITTTLFLWLWFANRRTYQMLKHQIPASVVKSYLDSIIQNSTSLKSSLFRGGGAELASAPAVFPVGNLGGGDSVAVAGASDGTLREQLTQKMAEIASLQSQLAAGTGTKKDLEAALAAAQARIKELEAMLAKASAGGGADPGLGAELQRVSQERDGLAEKLKEYEIIEDDLANLKRLQQENQQLRKALEAQGGALPDATPEPVAPEPEPADILADVPAAEAPAAADATAELEQFLGADEGPAAAVEPAPDAAAAAPEKKAAPGDKTPEDLLSEFEKMLG